MALRIKQANAVDEQTQAETYATVANVAFVTGAALVAVGAVWAVLLSRHSAAASRPSGPVALTLVGVRPLLTPAGGGATFLVRWP
jgi:hypothetical protein